MAWFSLFTCSIAETELGVVLPGDACRLVTVEKTTNTLRNQVLHPAA